MSETKLADRTISFVDQVCGLTYQSPYRGNPAMPSGDNWRCDKCGYRGKHDARPPCARATEGHK